MVKTWQLPTKEKVKIMTIIKFKYGYKNNSNVLFDNSITFK